MIAELAVVFVVSGMLNKLSTTTATLLFYLYAGSQRSGVFVHFCRVRFGLYRLYVLHHGRGVRGDERVWHGYQERYDQVRELLYHGIVRVDHRIGCQYIRGKQYSRLDYQFVRRGFVYRIDGMGHPKDQECGLCDRSFPDRELATIGALSLYLDFINLFLYLLRIFGGRSND